MHHLRTFRDGRQLDVIFGGVLEAKTALVCHHGLEANFAIQWLASIDARRAMLLLSEKERRGRLSMRNFRVTWAYQWESESTVTETSLIYQNGADHLPELWLDFSKTSQYQSFR